MLYCTLLERDASQTSVSNPPVPTLEPSRPCEEEEQNRENERVKVKKNNPLIPRYYFHVVCLRKCIKTLLLIIECECNNDHLIYIV